MEEAATALREQLAGRYGSAVTVEYLDVYSGALREHPEVTQLLTKNVPLPIVSLNGEPTFAGGISLEMIEEELQSQGLAPQA